MIPVSSPDDIDLHQHGMIEASAGTGKTYTIENLVVRLLKERPDVDLENILLVTFTEKATAELKFRLYDKIARETENRTIDSNVRQKLRDALDQFDGAAIHTIHGFCQTVLRDFAFEHQTTFETEVVDDRPLLESALLEDMRAEWPRRYGDRLEELLYLSGFQNRRKRLMDTIVHLAGTLNPQAGDRLLPQMPDGGYEEMTRLIVDTCMTIKTLMGDDDAFLTGYARLRFNARAKKSVTARILDPLATYFRDISEKKMDIRKLFQLLERIEEVSSMGQKGIDCLIPAKWNKGGPNLDVCPNLVRLRDQLAVLLKQADGLRCLLIHETVFRLQKRARELKTRKGWISYQDMLSRVAEALSRSQGNALMQKLRARFKVAFIDEFQDTDSIQWRIFNKLFLNSSNTDPENPQNRLFLIGDPKQAIYSFRGADVYAYLSARHNIRKLALKNRACIYSLTQNWRSVPELISAFNALFKARPWFPKQAEAADFEIGYEDVGHPAPEYRLNAVTRDSGGRGVFNIVDLTSLETPFDAKTGLATFIAREIQYLTQNPPYMSIGGEPERPLNPGDICILVRTRKEAVPVEKALMSHEIPYAFYKKPGIFLSREAFFTALLFRAILDPGDLSATRKALLTPFFGFRFSEVSAYEALPPTHSVKTLLFSWNQLAENRRWPRLFQSVVEDSGIFARDTVDGGWDRRHTNYHQILAFLQQEAYRKNLDFEGLCATLELHRKEAVAMDADTGLHQIETEAQKVQIMTMHVSKGLEFPVVFIAGGITGSAADLSPYHVYHSTREQNGRVDFSRTIDLTKSENPEKYRTEMEDETRRLFYVALTRARFKVYVPFREKRGGFRGPVATLLSPALINAFSAPPETGAAIQWLAHDLHPDPGTKTVSLSDQKDTPTVSTGTENAFQPDFPVFPAQTPFFNRGIFLDSFSGIHRRNMPPDTREPEGIYLETSAREDDRDEARVDASFTPSNALQVPGGIHTGLMFHDLLEQVDFSAFVSSSGPENTGRDASKDTEIQAMILKQMDIYRVDPAWHTSVYRILEHVLSAPIPAVSRGFRLAQLSADARRHELEFYYPLGPGRRFIRGFVDLVFEHDGRFYIADWKSNVLEGYDAHFLARSMDESGYHLQYRLYTIAVLRWLMQRLGEGFDPVKHFGGVFYFYLRGMGGKSGNGIYFVPPENLLPLKRLEQQVLEHDIGEPKWKTPF